jgi:peptide deformylase
MTIVTIFNDKTGCLSTKADNIALTPAGLTEARSIVQQLLQSLTPLMPAAGLAAPQIGISKQIFIYSWDRTLENIEAVLNPVIVEYGEESYFSWESCFSTIQENDVSQAVYISRAKSLIVEYVNREGKTVKQKLEGFAAKAFQHEYDHLQGIVDTQKENIQLNTFPSKQALIDFMTQIKKEDSLSYLKPISL